MAPEDVPTFVWENRLSNDPPEPGYDFLGRRTEDGRTALHLLVFYLLARHRLANHAPGTEAFAAFLEDCAAAVRFLLALAGPREKQLELLGAKDRWGRTAAWSAMLGELPELAALLWDEALGAHRPPLADELANQPHQPAKKYMDRLRALFCGETPLLARDAPDGRIPLKVALQNASAAFDRDALLAFLVPRPGTHVDPRAVAAVEADPTLRGLLVMRLLGCCDARKMSLQVALAIAEAVDAGASTHAIKQEDAPAIRAFARTLRYRGARDHMPTLKKALDKLRACLVDPEASRPRPAKRARV